MLLEKFKEKLNSILERNRFRALLKNRVNEGSKAFKYLKSRNLDTNFECYDYNGSFTYNGKDYQLPDCIVIPLRDVKGTLKGVWIRFLEEKRFFIWMCRDSQKYWIDVRNPQNNTLFVTEAIFDALSLRKMTQCQNVAAALGVSLTNDLLELMKDFNVVLCFDNDIAGFKGALSLLNKHPSLKILQPLQPLTSESYKDFNELSTKVDNLEYKILEGIQAKVYLRSKIG